MFRVHMFLPKEVESDQHVVAYKWMSQTVPPVHPPYYAFYYCPYCFFADLLDDFRDPSRSTAGHWLLKAYANPEKPQHPAIEFLGRYVNYGDLDFHSALNLHYLALLIQQMPPTDIRDAFKLGRLSLRVAWLYREAESVIDIPKGPKECEGQAFFDFPSYPAFREELRKIWPEVPASEMAATQIACEAMANAISTDSRFDSPKKYFQGIKLLLDLLKRCGDLDGAYQTVRGIYLEGMKSRQECQNILADKETSQARRERIAADLRIVNTYMADAGDLRDQFLEEMVERDMPRVLDILRDATGLPPKELEARIQAAGIEPEVLRRIKKKVAAVQQPKT